MTHVYDREMQQSINIDAFYLIEINKKDDIWEIQGCLPGKGVCLIGGHEDYDEAEKILLKLIEDSKNGT